MEYVLDRVLKKAFSDYEIPPSHGKGVYTVENLRLNPDADMLRFLRGLPVRIVQGTAASVTVNTGLSMISLAKDLWRAYKNNQTDLVLKVKVSGLTGGVTRCSPLKLRDVPLGISRVPCLNAFAV